MAIRAVMKDSFTESSNTTLTSHTPEIGSTYSVSAAMTVSGGNGYVGKATNGVATATLTGVSALAPVVIGTFKRVSSGAGAGAGPTVRNVTSGGLWNLTHYLFYPNQTDTDFFRATAGVYTLLASVAKSPTLPIYAKVIATGSSPTTLSGSVWSTSDAEPIAFDLTTSDNTAANQTSNPTPVGFYIEGAVTNGWVCDDLFAVEGAADPKASRQAITRAATF